MLDTRLILIDGIPGSGKSTIAEKLACRMRTAGVPCRFYHELEQNHPLQLPGSPVARLVAGQDIDWFVSTTFRLWKTFSRSRLQEHDIAIVESWLFQDTISFAYNLHLDEQLILDLMEGIKAAIRPLDPVLIYLYQCDVARTFQQICEARGPEWSKVMQGPDGSLTDAVATWGRNQEFVSSIVRGYDIPKLVIENQDFEWADQLRRVVEFVGVP